jgi:hypothetical protein
MKKGKGEEVLMWAGLKNKLRYAQALKLRVDCP